MSSAQANAISFNSEFSEHEKDLLRYSWSCLRSEKQELGAKIFALIFEQSPDAKDLFYFTRTKTPYEMSNITKDKEFRFHALRFIQIIENAIENLDELDGMNPLFKNLGKVHGKFQETRGFHTYYWSVFIECCIFRIRRTLKDAQGMDDYLDETIVAWRGLLLEIVKRMKVGYTENVDCRMLNRMSSSNHQDIARRLSKQSIKDETKQKNSC